LFNTIIMNTTMRRVVSVSNTQKDNNIHSTTSKFELKKLTLGKGNFSVVKLAIHPKTKEQVAAKVMDLLEWNKEYKNELFMLQKLNHISIIGYIDSERRRDGRGVIYLEYLSYPTLSSYIQNTSTLSEPIAVKVLYELVDAVDYMHSVGISHHDIKPDNILFNHETNSIKLFDFGLAVTVDPHNPMSATNAGSPLYMGPEVLLNQDHNVFKADVWSIGICFYEILTGKSPFDQCKVLDELIKEWESKIDLSLPIFLSSSKLRILYSQMVKYDPDRRISTSELKKILATLVSKRCLGNSLGGSGKKRKAERTTSVNAVIRRINGKSKKRTILLASSKDSY